MRKNKIEGVQPFNKFYFRSCYYHQLIAGLSCFGIPYESVIISYFIFPKQYFELEKKVFSEKDLEKILGYRNKKCDLSKKQLLSEIDKNRPMIVGVDCFYFESRPDTYLNAHDPHYVLVYGYDLDNNTLNVLDHSYRNSPEYIEKTIDLDNLLYSNKKLRCEPLKRKKTISILQKKKGDVLDVLSVLQRFEHERFEQAKTDSAFNLESLKSFVLHENSALEEKITKITQYLQEMKNFFINLESITLFTDTREKQIALSVITSAYSNLLSIFWKMENKHDYGFAFRSKETIIRKIDELLNAERFIYDYILEIYKCHTKQ